MDEVPAGERKKGPAYSGVKAVAGTNELKRVTWERTADTGYPDWGAVRERILGLTMFPGS